MGSVKTFIGPYIEFPVQVSESHYDKKVCSNGYCKQSKKQLTESSNFCSACGGALETETIFEQIERSQFDLFDEDRLCCILDRPIDGIETYISNSMPHIIDNYDSGNKIEITPELISEQIAMFKKVHKTDIELLKTKIIGEMEIKFGAFTYYS